MAAFNFTHPEKFDVSKPEAWEKWLRRFDRFRSASGLIDKSEETQVNTLLYSMGSEAEEIVASFGLSDADLKKWKPVTDKLNDYFVPKRNIIFERAKFNQRAQLMGETVDSFVTSLHTLAETCQFGALHDELIRDRIVVGLRDHRLSEHLQLDAALTLEKAITEARQRELVKAQQSTVHGTAEDAHTDSVKWQHGHKNQKSRKQTRQRKMSGQRCPVLQMQTAGTFPEAMPSYH